MTNPPDLVCHVIQVLMSEHGHGRGSLPKEVLCRFVDGDADQHVIECAVDLALELSFVDETRSDFIELRQTEELVDYLVDECDREPEFFKAYLNHVPPYVWDKYGVSPP